MLETEGFKGLHEPAMKAVGTVLTVLGQMACHLLVLAVTAIPNSGGRHVGKQQDICQSPKLKLAQVFRKL